MRTRLLLVGTLVFGLAAGAAMLSRRVRPPIAERPNLTAGAVCDLDAKPANLDFTLSDLHGQRVRLSDYKGRVLLLDFWATWCPPCKREIPGFIDLYETYKKQGLEVIGLLSLDAMANVPAFAHEFGMNYPILDANDCEDVERAYGPIAGLPTTLLISREGKICARHLGFTPVAQFDAEIRALLSTDPM
jgi:peroxiredoxin